MGMDSHMTQRELGLDVGSGPGLVELLSLEEFLFHLLLAWVLPPSLVHVIGMVQGPPMWWRKEGLTDCTKSLEGSIMLSKKRVKEDMIKEFLCGRERVVVFYEERPKEKVFERFLEEQGFEEIREVEIVGGGKDLSMPFYLLLFCLLVNT